MSELDRFIREKARESLDSLRKSAIDSLEQERRNRELTRKQRQIENDFEDIVKKQASTDFTKIVPDRLLNLIQDFASKMWMRRNARFGFLIEGTYSSHSNYDEKQDLLDLLKTRTYSSLTKSYTLMFEKELNSIGYGDSGVSTVRKAVFGLRTTDQNQIIFKMGSFEVGFENTEQWYSEIKDRMYRVYKGKRTEDELIVEKTSTGHVWWPDSDREAPGGTS